MANRYWVGGSGTWDASSTANWSATSGGAAGASAPVAIDNVFFDANSGTGTCTTASGSVCNNITFGSANVTLIFGANHTMTGAFVHTTGAIDLNNNVLTCLTFNSSTTTNTRSIAFGTGNITVTGNNTTVWTTSTSTGLTISGTPVVNAAYSGGTGTRTITGSASGAPSSHLTTINVTAGTDIISISGNRPYNSINFTGFSGSTSAASAARTLFGNLTLSSGMTLTAENGGFAFAGTSGTQQITTNAKTLDCPLTFNGVGGTFAFQDALTQGSTRSFTITNGTVQLKAGVTSTVGAFATTGTNQKFLQSTVAGSQATLSQAGGTVNSIYLTIKDINATGGATWNAYTTENNINAGNNLGWDFSFQIGRCIYTQRKNKRILP